MVGMGAVRERQVSSIAPAYCDWVDHGAIIETVE